MSRNIIKGYQTKTIILESVYGFETTIRKHENLLLKSLSILALKFKAKKLNCLIKK
jgi:hypothetical protein